MCVSVLCIYCGYHRDLHGLTDAYPTRRSSDLIGVSAVVVMVPMVWFSCAGWLCVAEDVRARARAGMDASAAAPAPAFSSIRRDCPVPLCLCPVMPALSVPLSVGIG